LENEHKKNIAKEYSPLCKKVFSPVAASRMRRSRNEDNGYGGDEDESENTVNAANDEEGNYELDGNHIKHHNGWLDQDQKKKVKSWQDEGHSEAEVHNKILDMFHISNDDVKGMARGILEKGCETIMERLFGQQTTEEILQMKENGASGAEMDEKIAGAVAEIRDEQKREEAGKFALTCRKIFSLVMRRRRSDPGVMPEHALEELFKTHLSWLSAEQQEQLKSLKDSGKGKTEIQAKTMEFYSATNGEQRQKAREHLQNGCRELLVSIVGRENAEELRKLRTEGATADQLNDKANALINAVEDEHKQKLAKEFGPSCRRIFLNQDPELTN